MGHTRLRGRRNACVRRRRRGLASLREQARAESAAAAAAGRSPRAASATCKCQHSVQLQTLLKKLTTLLGCGEAHALLARTSPHAREADVRVAVARAHVLHDDEKIVVAIFMMLRMLTCVSSLDKMSREYMPARWTRRPTRFSPMCGTPRAEKTSPRASQQCLAPCAEARTP